jgi:hypothetical protein
MRLDHVIIRLTAVLGAEWLQAYALLDLQPDVDIDKFRFELPKRLRYHHETEKYVGGVPGDLFVGFFCKGQGELFEQLGAIKAMKEVREVKEWAIANFPVAKPEMTQLDWRIVKSLRSGAQKTAKVIAAELKAEPRLVEERLNYIKQIPLAFSIEPPNDRAWTFTEIQLNFRGTTFQEKLAELRAIGKPFGASGSKNHGAIMVEPKSVAELVEMIRKTAQIPGVRVTDYAFCEDMIWTQPWLDRFIEDRIAECG